MTEIFIENKRADISEDLSSLITYALDDVKDFASRNTAFSKTIILPGTANNNKLFGNIFNVTISNPYDETEDNIQTNFNASVLADCIIFQNHIQVFKGTLRILEVVILDGVAEYEVAVSGELGGFISAMGARKLEDLDFSLYDHVYNSANAIASWNASGGTSYFYPLIDYGGVSVAKVDYDIRALRPALFVREYLDKIFTNAGYRFECDLFDTERFRRLVIPHNKKNLIALQTLLLNTSSGVQSQSASYDIVFTGTMVGSGFTKDVTNTQFTYVGAAATTATIAFSFSQDFQFLLHPAVTFEILLNGTPIYTDTKTGLVNLFSGSISASINPSDVIIFRLNFTGGATVRVNGSFQIDSAIATPLPITPGNTIVMNDTLPQNVLQKDFLQSIIRLFNLYVYEDKNETKKLFISPYVDFFDLNVSGVVDWTYKVDRSKAIHLKPMSELTSRYYDFKFKEDGDYYNDLYKRRYGEPYGANFYDSAFQMTNERTLVEVIFSPSVLVGYVGADKIVTAMYKQSAGVEEKMDTNIRILQTKKITGVTSWSIKDANTVLQSGITDYGYGGHYDDPDVPANDLHFGVPKELFFTILSGAINVTQFNVYWSPYMAEITDKDSKLYVATAKLTAQDIFDLQFSRLIYCDGTYWRLNKIEDYNATMPDTCKIELLKVINLLY